MPWSERKLVQEGVPSTALLFDSRHELLYAGNRQGRITSHVMDLQQPSSFYTRFVAHTSHRISHGRLLRQHPTSFDMLQPKTAVKDILEHEYGVFSVSSNSVHLSSVQGLSRWHHIVCVPISNTHSVLYH
jgi:hypothetical protein